MLSRRDLFHAAAAASLPLWYRPFATASAGWLAPEDARQKPAKTLNDYFPFTPPETLAAWKKRRTQLREQVLVSQGLWPLPEKTPLNAVVYGAIERDGYTVSKVMFSSTPGHYVYGNLYRPTGETSTKRPAVLFAHGHWAGGRFHVENEANAKKAVERGEEPDLVRGQYFMQALPATLARLGFVVFHYDMIGYADSTAIPHREGFKDAAAELRLQSFMGLQTWNSIRALDFLGEQPDVDPAKIGITGASGGGTQTFILAAVDDRIAAAFPAVMVSTAMQGGCVCENASYLRLETGNIELAGLVAPKPLAMSAADDWTKEILTKGLPELKQLYKLHGVPELVEAKYWPFPHNYGHPSRLFMYAWFQKHLAGKDEPVEEKPFTPIPPKELSVLDAEHPRPKDELPAGRLREKLTEASEKTMAALMPRDAKSLAEFRKVIGAAARVMLMEELPPQQPGLVKVHDWKEDEMPDSIRVHKATLERDGTTVPSEGLIPPQFNQTAVLWVHPQGRASLYDNGKVQPAVNAILTSGTAVLALDLFEPKQPLAITKETYGHVFGGYFYGYNRSLLAQRVRDVITAIVNLRDNAGCKTIHVAGWGEAGPVAVLAAALAGNAVTKIAVDLNQFRFESITKLDDPMMLPGAVKYGGLPAFLALCAPKPLFVHNHKGTASGQLTRAAYETAGAAKELHRHEERVAPEKVVAWLNGK